MFQIINKTILTSWDDEIVGQWDTGQNWGLFYVNAAVKYGMNDSPNMNYENNKSIRLNVFENGTFQFVSSSDLDVAPGGTVKISDIGDDYTSIDGIVFSDSTGNDKTCEGSGTYEYCIGDTLKGGSQYDGNYEIYVNFFSQSDNCAPRKALLEAGEKIWFKKL